MESWTSTRMRIATCLMGVATLLCIPAARAADGGIMPNPVPAATAPTPAGPAVSNVISAELMKSIRAATFEVVLKKPETDPLQYERPLPLELLPFAERNDKYRSIGTAFAIAPGSFVTAAHVTTAASASQGGIPALRDAQGNVFPIDRVTRYSLHEDFIVFTVSGNPRVTPLPTSTDFQFDTPVFAVGNALGQGIVARDGILTSETPEDQDGRWKWLRFSAPASPGNSGGPLLDAKGRVIGLISRKSTNENLNYALPIALVLSAPTSKGSIDTRLTAALPILVARKTVKIKLDFDLPLRFADFDRKILAINDEQVAAAKRQLLQESAATLFPRGKSSRLLADTFLTSTPALIAQQADGSWDVPRTAAGNTAQLGNDGFIWIGAQSGAAMFRIRYASDVDLTRARGDSKLLSEQLLKGLAISRNFGNENVRIISLGDAGKPREFKDDFGRTWQEWRYPMPVSDTTMIITVLPTPEGCLGFLRSTVGFAVEQTAAEMRMLANFLQVSYSGSLPQWRAFLADTHLRPDSFGKWKAALDPAGEVSLELPRLSVKIDKQVLNLTEKSQLNIFPGTLLDGDRPAWDVLALTFNLELRASPGIGLLRRAKPAADAGPAPVNRWSDMVQQSGQYAGNPVRGQNGGTARKVAGAEGTPFTEAAFLYEVTYSTTTNVQGEIQQAMPLLTEMIHITEK